MKKQITLEQIFPNKPEFFLSSRGRAYAVRPPTMRDQVWFREKYGDEKLQRVLNEMDWGEIVKIIYHHLSDDDKREFLSQTATIINDEGDEATVRLSGPEVLLSSLAGLEESLQMLGAFNRALAMSNPIIEEEIKKKMDQFASQIGDTSSTASRPNTAGQKKKSRA